MPLLASLVFMNQIKFNPRWKEELVAVSDEGVLIFEIAMGAVHVYFPDEQKGLVSVPGWAKEKWQAYLDACTTGVDKTGSR